MIFTIPFDDLDTGAVADTFKTMVAAFAADTLGYRFWLQGITVGPAEDAPVDLNIDIQLCRVDDVSAGGVGTKTASTPMPHDPLSRASIIAGAVDHTAEPTTYGNPLWQMPFHLKSGLMKEWDFEHSFKAHRDQLIGMLAAPRTSVLRVLSGSLTIVEF